jgi:hypothetical protein
VVYKEKKISYISLNQDYALIDNLGNLITPLAITKSGDWYNERIAELLPMNYSPK